MKNQSLDKLLDSIKEFLKSLPEGEEKILSTDQIVFEAVIWGSNNSYEAVGLLEKVKHDYINTVEEIASEGQREEEEEDFVNSNVVSPYTC